MWRSQIQIIFNFKTNPDLMLPGSGTFGRVFLVEDTSRDKTSGKKRPLALKIMKLSDIIRMEQIEHVNSERKIAEMMQNPFIVQW